MNTALLDGLNPVQKQAVTFGLGPMLILAGAGSGKTKVLTHRVAHLIQEQGVLPENILAVTFTNKAAGEMRGRIERLLQSPKTDATVHLPWLGTFHAICVRILRREAVQLGFSASFTIYDSLDQKHLMKATLEEMGLDLKQFQPQTVLYYISGAKNELMWPVQYVQFAEGYFQETVARAYERYQKKLMQANAMDFDDLIMLTIKAFQDDPALLERYQDLFHYVLVDEYQDTNAAQYQLVKMLAQKRRNICVVGDDYQAIYSWRGANFRNILNFERDYPDAYVVKLEQNYRSTKTILDGANAVIAKNIHRSDKTLWTDNVVGLPITVYEALNELDEAEFVAQETIALKKSGLYHGLKSCAVLYRTNAQSRVLEEVLLRSKIPYRILGGLRFYARKEVKDVLAYFRLVINPTDNVSLARTLSTPPRGIGKKSIDALLQSGTVMNLVDDSKLSTKAKASFAQFRHMIEHLRQMYDDQSDLGSLFDFLISQSGYGDWLNDGTAEGQSRLENIGELKTALSREQSLESFLENAALQSDIDEYDETVDTLTLMTLHAAKGLEFPVVFMCGMEEGIFPHSRSSFDPSEIEEERRLCYVGMTRSKERLYLIHASERRLYGGLQMNPPSRFLGDIPVDLLDVL